MKIFISWSGNQSKRVAIALRDWLPCVFQGVVPFVSSEDLRKGKRWLAELTHELETSSFGILCLTRKNIESPWILFEAGALSKAVNESYACTLLLGGLKNVEVTGPLSNFQHTIFEKTDFRKLAGTINEALKEKKLKDELLEKVFEKFWPDLDASVQKAMQAEQTESVRPTRTERDILEEVLTLSRFIARNAVPVDAESSMTATMNKLRKLLYLDIAELEFPARLTALLKNAGVENVGALATSTADDLRRHRGIKETDIKTVTEKMDALGLALGMTFNSDMWARDTF